MIRGSLPDYQRSSSPLSTRDSPLQQVPSPDHDVDLSVQFHGLQLEENGPIAFHGLTSFFQLPSCNANLFLFSRQSRIMDSDSRERLIKCAWRESNFEQYRQVKEPFKYLLASYWCWTQPLFNFIYRPAFTRDFPSGPYFSTALYNAVLSHSVGQCKEDALLREQLYPYQGGTQFLNAAISEALEDLGKGEASIPLVQTLLLLSVQHCDQGNTTQAWLYSGMAFRLVEDMGICVDGRNYACATKLSEEDIEIRSRLFWSCYLWEKILCLYLGRAPSIRKSPSSPPQIMCKNP